MKIITALLGLLFVACESAVTIEPPKEGKATFVDSVREGHTMSLMVAMDQTSSTGDKVYGYLYFTLTPDVAGTDAELTCTATLNDATLTYSMSLYLRRNLYPTLTAYNCKSDSDNDNPDVEECFMNDFEARLRTIFGLVLLENRTASAYLGDSRTVDVLCETEDINVRATVARARCLSGETMVNVLGHGPTPMKDLQLHDKVQVNENGIYEPVYAFAHLDKAAEGAFLQIYHDSGKPLEITKDHLVSIGGNMRPAEDIAVGDIFQGPNGPRKVTKIKTVKRFGLYAPLTPSGTIIVNDIVVSNYVLLQNGSQMVKLQGGITIPVSQHWMTHVYISPWRMACLGIHSGLCSNEWLQEDTGYPTYINAGLKLGEWADKQNVLVQSIILLLFLFTFGLVYALECFLGATNAPFLVALGACVVGLTLGAEKVVFREYTEATMEKKTE